MHPNDIFVILGPIQRQTNEPGLLERVDPDAPRHEGRALLRSTRDRPSLQIGNRQESSRGQEENVKDHLFRKIQPSKSLPH